MKKNGNNSTESFVLKAGETKIIDNSFPRVFNKITLEDNSQLLLSEAEPEINITVGELIMGENVIISTRGLNGGNGISYTGSHSRITVGARTGAHGEKGGEGTDGKQGRGITINCDRLKFISFTLVTSGGDGGNGGNGKGGGKGSNSNCSGQTGGAGGNGGKGGDGGDGGNAGQALITFNEFQIIPNSSGAFFTNPYNWKAEGGDGGNGGKGGPAGPGGNGSKCGCWNLPFSSGCAYTVSGGNGGNTGADGRSGNNGQDLIPNEFKWFRYN